MLKKILKFPKIRHFEYEAEDLAYHTHDTQHMEYKWTSDKNQSQEGLFGIHKETLGGVEINKLTYMFFLLKQKSKWLYWAD